MPYLTLIFILLIIVFLAFTRLAFKATQGKSSISVYNRFIIYGAVILISIGLVTFIPHDDKVQRDPDLKIDHYPNLDVMVYDDQWDEELLKEFIVSVERINYDQDTLILDHPLSHGGDISHAITVFVDQSLPTDESMEVILYETPTVFSGYDISEDYGSFTAELDNNRINIYSEQIDLHYSLFIPPFSLRLFEKDGLTMFGEDVRRGERLVYLKVPEDLKIRAADENYINILYKD